MAFAVAVSRDGPNLPELTKEAFEDLNEAVSHLAYWVASADDGALLRIVQGFGAAIEWSASKRSEGAAPETLTLALAERAHQLQAAEDARHAGWLLLSIELELVQHAADPIGLLGKDAVQCLAREAEEVGQELMRRGARALASG